MEELVTILVPIFLCVVLPVAIVAIIYWEKINSTNKRTQVLIKAIEANKASMPTNLPKLCPDSVSRPKRFSTAACSEGVCSRS